MALLECLGGSDGGLSQADLCVRLGITQSSCYRIIQTLLASGWVRKDKGNRYDLAVGMLSVVGKLTDMTRRFERFQPWLEQLSTRTGLSCKLSVRRGEEQETVLRAESPLPMTVSGKLGARFPLVEGSVGAALLADTEEQEVMELCRRCREDIRERGDAGIVLKRIASIRKDGCCGSDRYSRWNSEALSAPVRDGEGGLVAALTLLGFPGDFDGERGVEPRRMLLEMAKAIGKTL